MARYGNFNINKKKKKNKPLIILLCVIAAALIALFIIGVTAGSDGEGMAKMSAAVRENTELKAEVSEMTEEIARLNGVIADLEAQIAAMPTLPPVEETPLPGASPAANTAEPDYESLSPREGFR